MMMMKNQRLMKNKMLKQLLSIEVLLMVVLGGIHYLALLFILPPSYMSYKIIYIYIFLIFLSLAGTLSIFLIHKNDDSLIGKGFLAFTIIKIMGSFVFLLPYLMDQDDFTRPFVYQFFGVFFPSLFVETYVILRLLKVVDKQNAKDE